MIKPLKRRKQSPLSLSHNYLFNPLNPWSRNVKPLKTPSNHTKPFLSRQYDWDQDLSQKEHWKPKKPITHKIFKAEDKENNPVSLRKGASSTPFEKNCQKFPQNQEIRHQLKEIKVAQSLQTFPKPCERKKITCKPNYRFDSIGSISEPEWVQELLDDEPELISCEEEPWKELYHSSDETVEFQDTQFQEIETVDQAMLKEEDEEDEEEEKTQQQSIWDKDLKNSPHRKIKQVSCKSIRHNLLKKNLSTQGTYYLLQISQGSKMAISFNTQTLSRTKIELPITIPHGCAVVQTIVALIVSGGGYSSSSKKSMVTINSKGKILYQSDSAWEFSYHSITSSYKQVYALGGFSPRGSISSATEKYRLDSKKWSISPHMAIPRIKPGCSFIGSFVYCFGGYVRNFKTGIEGIERLNTQTMKEWNIVRIKSKICGINGLIGMTVIRMNKDRIALFGGRIIPLEDRNRLTPQLLRSEKCYKSDALGGIDFRYSASFAFPKKMDLALGSAPRSIVSVVREKKLFFLHEDKVVTFMRNKWYSLAI